ncbi:hypothetical protein GCM10025331_47970 [Actinoplanes utahensis]
MSLEEAVRAAVQHGHTELTRLDAVTAELAGVFERERDAGPAPLDEIVRRFPEELRRHLDRERESLGRFNIAFFGRTGVGKSTLLSTFGRLDGEYVSPGDNDWTTEVRPIEWRDCRLYDTPGINGWGRTESRAGLEAKARRAVEIADVVLLCFDTQAQQEMEFAKIAAWIRDHGKPVVAVLNVRNPMWRHPARVVPALRRNLSEPVRQHAGNISAQLARIGLPDTPVVAIHSQRALFARAAVPFRGPGQLQKGFHRQREQFGVDYLDRFSNFGTLERLIVNAIAEGGADLRLAALREDVRARCRRAAGELSDLAAEVEREAEARERTAESLFALLGYPDGDERTELVGESERARDRPYTAPVKGALDRFVRHLAASHLAGCRRQAKAAVDELIRTAFDERRTIDQETFTATVFDRDAVAAAAAAVWADRRAFLQRELAVAVDQDTTGGSLAVSHAATILGGEGSGVAGDVVRGSGIVVGLGALAVPAVAALLSNPIGWVIAATAAGVGIAGQIQQHFGKKITQQRSEQARKARAQAIADGHRAVDQTFDEAEDTLVRDSRAAAWTLLAPAVAESLHAAVELRSAHRRIDRLIDGVRACAETISPAPAVGDVMHRARRRTGELLGEDWLEAGAGRQPAPIDPAVEEAYAAHRRQDRDRLARVTAAAWDTAGVPGWLARLEDAARHDPALLDIVATFRRVRAARPALAVLGDYNSGKSSLIRRIVVDSGGPAHTGFDIRAMPATTAATRYELQRFDLVDTPGLQSGDAGHDTTALEAIVEAALVLVVVHINLLIGDTATLERLARGSETLAAKGGRMVFLINRCDELGVDPLTEPEDFRNLQDRKREELRAALATRSVDVGADRIHCLAGDPFGQVGADTSAGPGSFDSTRLWDGVAALTGAMTALTGDHLTAAATTAALDAAVTALKRHRHTLEQEQSDGTRELHRSEPVIDTLRDAVKDAVLIEGALREDARRMVDRHVVAARSAVARLDRRDARKLEDLVASWWKSPAFEADLERYLADAARRLDEWHSDHVSAIGREMRAAEFQVTPAFAAEFSAHGSTWGESLTQNAGNVAGAAASLARALGNRDAVYAIGKQLGHDFKPWGAVQGGATVAKASIVLGAVAAAVDVASMVGDIRKAGKHEDQLRAAAREIDEAAAGIVAQILDGEQGDGPAGYLAQRTRELEALLDEHLERVTSVKKRIDAAAARAATATALITAADAGTGTPGGDE